MEVREEFAIGDASVRLHYGGFSDTGSVRARNEDSFLTAPPFWVVADGMGGHVNGERASMSAVATFADAADGAPVSARLVLDLVREANIVVRAHQEDGLSGTTLTGVALVELPGAGVHWMAFNVGDSRTYVWDGRNLSQQSVDHSAVQELVDAGVIDAEEAAHHPQRNVVTRALGAEEEVEADVWLLPLAGRQTFLLCSDGLTKELDDDEIARIITFHDQQALEEGSPSLPERLVRAAVAAGGRDNVTVVVVESTIPDHGQAGEQTSERGRVLDDTKPRS